MIYIRGDTHGDLDAIAAMERFHSEQWDETVKLVITGDFQFVFRGGDGNPKEKSKLDALAEKPYEILFLDGNHEGFDALEQYPLEQRYGAPVRRIRERIFWLQRGYVYIIEGHTFFVMGGGYSLDKADRLARESLGAPKEWFHQEMPCKEEYDRAVASLQSRDLAVDYVLTHTAPSLVIPRIIGKAPDPHEGQLTEFLNWVYQDCRYKKWYCGHFHVDLAVHDQFVACLDALHRIGGRDLLDERWQWLYDLGYTRQELEIWNAQIARDLAQLLENEDYVAYMKPNMQQMLENYDNEEAFRFLLCFPDAFLQNPSCFRRRLEQIQSCLGDTWAQVVWEQLWQEDDRCIIGAIAYRSEDPWLRALVHLNTFAARINTDPKE